MFVKRLFKNFDFMSDHPELLINKRNRLTSIYGGLLSLVYFLLIIAILYLFGVEFIVRTRPYVLVNSLINNEEDYFNFEINKFQIYYGVSNDNVRESTDANQKKKFEYEYYLKKQNIISNYNNDKLIINNNELEYEKNLEFENKNIDSFNKMYYLNLSSNLMLNYESTFNINFLLNNNNQTEVNNNFIILNLTSNIINLENYQLPFQQTNSTHKIYFVQNFEIEIEIPIVIYEIKTDHGIFLEDHYDISTYIIDTQRINNYIRNSYDNPEQSNSKIKIKIILSKEKISIFRSYMKFHEVMHSIGGLKEFFSLIAYLLYYFYNDVNTKLYLVNKYFDIPLNTKKLTESDKSNKGKVFHNSKMRNNKINEKLNEILKDESGINFKNNYDEMNNNNKLNYILNKNPLNKKKTIILEDFNKSVRYEHQRLEVSSRRIIDNNKLKRNKYSDAISNNSSYQVNNSFDIKSEYSNKNKIDKNEDNNNDKMKNLQSLFLKDKSKKDISLNSDQICNKRNRSLSNCEVPRKSNNNILLIDNIENEINNKQDKQDVKSKSSRHLKFYNIHKDNDFTIEENSNEKLTSKELYYSKFKKESNNNIFIHEKPNLKEETLNEENLPKSESICSVNYKSLSRTLNLPKDIFKPKNRDKIELGLFSEFFFCILCQNKNEQKLLLNRGYEMIRGALSIENIIDLTRNVAKLRYFLLTNYENAMLDYLGNPIIENMIRPDNHYDNMDIFIKSFTEEAGTEKIEFPMKNREIVDISKNNFPLIKISEAYSQRP